MVASDYAIGEIKAQLARSGLRMYEVSESMGHGPSWLTLRMTHRAKLTLDDAVSICEAIGMNPHALLPDPTWSSL